MSIDGETSLLYSLFHTHTFSLSRSPPLSLSLSLIVFVSLSHFAFIALLIAHIAFESSLY